MGIARSKFPHQFSRQSLTLQRVLKASGYRIGLILGGDHTNFYGLAQALGPADFYWDGSLAGSYVNDDREVLKRARALPAWDGTPTFIQFHLMSSHGLGKREDAFGRFQPARNYYRRGALSFDEAARVELAGNYYDNGVLQLDSIVRELLETLQASGYLDDALVVITGDHGEMLGEHGEYSHASGVYAPVLDIPLIVMRHGYQGRALAQPRAHSQVDIAPTILEELQLPIPPGWSGIPLQRAQDRDFLYFQQAERVGLLDLRSPRQPWKVWTDIKRKQNFAFDMAADAGETENRYSTVAPALRSEWMLQLLPGASASNAVPEANRTPIE